MNRCLVVAAIGWYFGWAAASSAEEIRPPAVVHALQASLAKNVDHARSWLAAKDHKSLAQSAGGLEIVAEVLRAQSDDDAWKAASSRIVEAARAVRAAAQREDGAAATEALVWLEMEQAASARLEPSGQPLPPPKANLRTLMFLMDGVRGDAKIALIVGDVESAKNQAYVLSELGRVVSNLQSGDRWSRLSEDFRATALDAAGSPVTEATEMRPLLQAISQRCDACHDTR